MKQRQNRGQSLVEFALIAPLLLLLLAAGSDFARVFFVSSNVADSTREAALYASQHGADPGQTLANLKVQMKSVVMNAEQGGFAPLKCSTWTNPPSDSQVNITLVSGTIPPAAGSQTTVKIVATCNIPALFKYPGIPSIYSPAVQVVSQVVGGI